MSGSRVCLALLVGGALLGGLLSPAPAYASGAPASLSSSMMGGAATPAAQSSGGCSLGSTILNTLNPFSSCNPARQAIGAIAGIPGDLAKAAATGIMNQVTAWMVQAAQTISGWVVKEAGVITSPDLNASWYMNLFSGLAALGGALAGLVGLIALGSAAIRRDPDALGEVIYGLARAGIGTSIVIALTVIALAAADAISNGFARQMPADFYNALAHQWSGSGWGGFGAAALAFLVAFVATIAGLLVWIELIVREAAIYIAVLFFPIGLAASIWPALRSWVRRLSMLLLMFVLLRPVVVIVLALAGSVTASGLSFGSGSIPHSVGTILAGVVIFALAAFTPWALMFFLGTEIGVMYNRGSSGSNTGARGSSGPGQQRLGGALGGGALTGGAGEPAVAGAGAEGGAASAGGMRLSSLGGSGSNGAGASSGPVAAAAGWASAIGRAGGHLAQHGAARIQVAAGRGGVTPGGPIPPWEGGGSSGSGAAHSSRGGPEPPPPASWSQTSPLAATDPGSGEPPESAPSPEAPSPVDSAVPPPPPTPAVPDETPAPPAPTPPLTPQQTPPEHPAQPPSSSPRPVSRDDRPGRRP